MTAPGRSWKRTFAGLVLATFVAPVATALCFEVAFLLTLDSAARNVVDEIGSAPVFLIFAFFFGGLLAAGPVLIFGGIAISAARLVGTRSPVYYTAAGLLFGLFMAWVDAERTQSTFNILEAIPFIVGGCSSALAYWWIGER